MIYSGVVYYCTTGNTNSVPPSGNWTTGNSAIAAPGAIPVPNAHVVLAGGNGTNTVSTAAANATWKSVYSPSQGNVGFSASNANLRLWELLNFTSDPFYEFHLVLTATTAPTANGNISLQFTWVR